MDIGVHLPHLGRQVDRVTLINFAQEAERLGCHSAWVSDHICWPAKIDSKYPYTDDGSFGPSSNMGWLDPITTLTFVSACTQTIRLGTSVLILPYRPPVQTAKQIATLDVLSEGRLTIGVGVGWMREEAEIIGMPWNRRGERTDEQLSIFRLLFEQPAPNFHGKHYQFPKVGFEPKPLQKPFPFWIGGSSPAAFRRAAYFGEAFHAAFQAKDVIEKEWSEVKIACDQLGRDPESIRLSLRIYLDPAQTMPESQSLAGSKDQMLETISGLKNIGVSHLLLDPVAKGGVRGRLDAIRAFMEDIAPTI